ncbi:putative disease resistance protein [Quercus suber]|uniref:Disease resistance protein n=1 Tax=Quercus suber TaxID=58331 RepID=A0AAW0JCW0_QUESU
MAVVVVGPALGLAFRQGFMLLRDTVKAVVDRTRMFKSILERLDSTLNCLTPMVDQIIEISEKLNLPERETKRLKEHMEEEVKLVRKCLTIRWWNYVFKFKNSSKLKELDEEIVRFCWLDLIAQCTRNGLMALENSQNMNRMLEKLMIRDIPRPVWCAVRERTEFTVGLDMPTRELNTLLLKEKVRLLLLTAPGGCGKTKLVEMLCQDEQIKAPRGNLEQDLRLIEDDIDVVLVCKLNEGRPRDTILLYVESGHAPFAIEVPNGVGAGGATSGAIRAATWPNTDKPQPSNFPPSNIDLDEEWAESILENDIASVDGFDDEQRPGNPEFNERIDMTNVQLVKGMKFPNSKVFKKA